MLSVRRTFLPRVHHSPQMIYIILHHMNCFPTPPCSTPPYPSPLPSYGTLFSHLYSPFFFSMRESLSSAPNLNQTSISLQLTQLKSNMTPLLSPTVTLLVFLSEFHFILLRLILSELPSIRLIYRSCQAAVYHTVSSPLSPLISSPLSCFTILALGAVQYPAMEVLFESIHILDNAHLSHRTVGHSDLHVAGTSLPCAVRT